MPEFRAFHNSELRAVSGHRLRGYAAVFNSLSEPLENGRFRETIRPGAFRNSLAAGEDVRALINHDASKVIGRTKSGTLPLEEDSRGLLMNVSLPDTSVGNDLWESVRRGDINQCSFGFRTIKDAWPSRDRRELIEVSVFDVSVVTYPAYPQTSVSARGLDLGWYIGNEPMITSPVEDERERLKLQLRLARMIQGGTWKHHH